MINPVHRLKKFVKYVGDDKSASSYVTGASGWLGSGITDQNGREIFEGNIVRNCFNTAEVTFHDGAFWLDGDLLATFKRDCSELEIVGHIAEEQS